MKNNFTIQKTSDGSTTIYVPELDETYHSSHGAIQEAKHVFIENGIKLITKDKIRVLEVGFGTGLNAILTSEYSKSEIKKIDYVGLETIPLEIDLINELNYLSEDKQLSKDDFFKIHTVDWNLKQSIHNDFTLTKRLVEIQEYTDSESFDIVYYDAFGPRAQSEMWDKSIFEKLYNLIKTDGILVTYCAMGQFKRDLKAIGFLVNCVSGPPGKREMTIAYKEK